MKNLTIFSTSTAYENATLELPNVSLIEDGMEVRYAPYVRDYSKEYFTIECLSAGTITIWASNASVYKTISYSIDDGSTWTDITSSTSGTSLGSYAIGDKLLVKGINNGYADENNADVWFNYFGGTAQVKVYGNIMSLVYGDNFIGQITLNGAGNFANLFKNYINLIDVANLILPATTLTTGCYYYMFNGCTGLITTLKLPATTLVNFCYYSMFSGCTSLTKTPDLPATTLASSCYYGMFYNCTSLIQAPELPATTLALSCYDTMFKSCSSLTKAPELPATILAEQCYIHMFQNCTSLTKAPELPATTLIKNCYREMFRNCTSLNEIICLATNISASNCTTDWVQNVAASGTFIKNPNMSSWTTGDSGIPSGWTVQTASL